LDDAATLAMGEAFDNACASLCRFRTLITARELIALIPFGIEDMSVLVT